MIATKGYAVHSKTDQLTITGSSIGGVAETQEMLNYCAAHSIVPDTLN